MPTVREVLQLAAVRRGQPQVVAAAGGLDRPVRWVHAIEFADAARLLRGGELVLTTGIALPDEEALIGAYVAGLAGVGVSALAVELGRKYTGGLPAAFVAAAEDRGLPLVVFTREVPFIEITEAVHALIIDDQLEQLRASARLHEVFTDLAVAGAGPAEHPPRGRAAGGPAADPGRPVAPRARLRVRRDAIRPPCWRTSGPAPPRCRPRRAPPITPAPAGWSPPWGPAARTGAGSSWSAPGRLRPVDTVLVERAATTLALGRLLARQQESLERQAHRTLISILLAQPDADPDEMAAQCRALGVPVTGRQLITAVIRSPDGGAGLLAQARVLDLAEALADACRTERIPALVGSLDDVRAGALLSAGAGADPEQVLAGVCAAARLALARRARRPYGMPSGEPVIGVGTPASSMREARRSLLEARQVADAAADSSHAQDGGAQDGRPFYRLADLRLRGLLSLLGGDARLATFVDRELGPLRDYDADHGTDLTGVLAAYLAAGGNKAEAAARAHLARPTLYERLRHIERILGVSLDSAESRTSLHVALLIAARAAQPPEA